jgi:hypothetical protein
MEDHKVARDNKRKNVYCDKAIEFIRLNNNMKKKVEKREIIESFQLHKTLNPI